MEHPEAKKRSLSKMWRLRIGTRPALEGALMWALIPILQPLSLKPSSLHDTSPDNLATVHGSFWASVETKFCEVCLCQRLRAGPPGEDVVVQLHSSRG